jgi:hypothetical protein
MLHNQAYDGTDLWDQYAEAQWRKPRVANFPRECCPNATHRRQAINRFRRMPAGLDFEMETAAALIPGPDQIIAMQSISMSNGPVHSGMQTKIRAGGSSGK